MSRVDDRGDSAVLPWSVPLGRGITIREYFVGRALTGLLANPMNTRESLSLMADLAWQAADAALANQGCELAGGEEE